MNPPVQFAHRFTHRVTLPGHALLVADGDFVLLSDPLARAVVGQVNGSRSAVQIAHCLEAEFAPAHVHFTILSLVDAGVLSEATERPGDAAGPSTPDTGTFDQDPLAEALERMWTSRGPAAVVHVPQDELPGVAADLLLTDDYLVPDLARALGAVPEHGPVRPVLPARVGRREVWLGPSFPGSGGSCVHCLLDRLRLNLPWRTLVHGEPAAGGDTAVVDPLPGGPMKAVFRLLADSLVRWGSDGTANSRSVLRVSTSAGIPPRRHPVPRVPHCPRCGDPTVTIPGADLELTSRPIVPGSGSGYRIVGAEATLAEYEHLVDPLTGLVRRIEPTPVTGLHGLHTYTASHAHHFGPASLRVLLEEGRDQSGGKGASDLDARVSALCESLERYSSVHRGTEPTRLARSSDLGEVAICPNDLLCFSDHQFEAREEWNEAFGGGFQWIPEPYADEEIEWSPVRSLVTGEIRWVPTAALFFGFVGEGDRFIDGDSNGLAGGNCLEEAVLQGLLEVIERDAVAIWWYNRVGRPGVSPESIADPWIQAMIEGYAGLGRDLWFLDLTTDLGIPTYVGISSRDGREIAFGFGAHLDPAIALRRAQSEVNQMLPSVAPDETARRAELGREFPEAVRWWDEATLQDHPYLLPDPSAPVVRDRLAPQPDDTDLIRHLNRCLDRVSRAGLDVLVHDLTRADVGFPVAKVFVPGLRHFWRRLGAGRLYRVPVAMGWLQSPTRESELNATSMFV